MRLAVRVGKSNALLIALVYGVVINLALIPLAEPKNVAVLWGFHFELRRRLRRGSHITSVHDG